MEEESGNAQVNIVLAGAIAIGTAAGCGIVMAVTIVMLSVLTSV